MEWSKMKTMIILILLAVNISLLGLTLSRSGARADSERVSREELIAVFARNGIELEEGQIPDEDTMREVRFDRDWEQERKIAGILGETRESDQGGGIYIHTGPGGSALFRGNGEFDIAVNEGAISVEPSGYEAYALSLLGRMGFDAAGGRADMERSGDAVSLRSEQSQDGLPVFNCEITVTFENGSLISVSGRRLTSEAVDSRTISAVGIETALVRFLNYLNTEGDVCNRVLSIQQGYLARTSASEPLSLTPVWKITTDTGAYYAGGESGSVEKAG